jgi:hypothetical protein
MANNNMPPEIKELAVRTSAAFMLFDMLARILDDHGIIERDDLADDILDIVKDRRKDLAKIAGGGGLLKDVLDAIEGFAKRRHASEVIGRMTPRQFFDEVAEPNAQQAMANRGERWRTSGSPCNTDDDPGVPSGSA